MELKGLEGNHVLTGISEKQIEVEGDWGDKLKCFAFSFELDGNVYTAIEDPADGYRSYLKKLAVNEYKINTVIPKTKVRVEHITLTDDFCKEECDLLKVYDKISEKIILEVGVKNIDDYYPYYVAHWKPQNLHYNLSKEDDTQ